MTLAELAAEMRANGAGRATVDGITLDLTVAPLPLAVEQATAARHEPETVEDAQKRRSAILLRSTGGVKVRLR